MEFSVEKTPSQKEFIQNIEAKEHNPSFTGDIKGLLRPEIPYDQEAAFHWLKETVIPRI